MRAFLLVLNLNVVEHRLCVEIHGLEELFKVFLIELSFCVGLDSLSLECMNHKILDNI